MIDEKKSLNIELLEHCSLKFNERGLIPVIAQDSVSGDVLMMAWMDSQAIRKTLSSGRVTYWSRSRQSYWVKGETSGNIQKLIQLRADCDRDCLLAIVEQHGNACHMGMKSCFFTNVEL